MDREVYNNYVTILNRELIPAMGCTEPIALAYCACKAKEILGEVPLKTKAYICGNIIKNAKSVTVPNTNNLKGIEGAIAAGYFCHDSNSELEVLNSLTSTDVKSINEYLLLNNIEVIPSTVKCKLFISLEIYGLKDKVIVSIANEHNNIVQIIKNDKCILNKEYLSDLSIMPMYKSLNIHDITNFVEEVNLDDVEDLILRQINYNYDIAKEGLKNEYGANIGKVLLSSYEASSLNKAKAYAAAASDARMSGCAKPVIILSGSGNQGITASVPIYVYGLEHNKDINEIVKAVLLSDLITLDQKKEIGRLSAFCGATVAAIGAACGIAYLDGGNEKVINHTIVNSLAIISGMVCDGAKASCAAKIAEALDSAFLGYKMYMCHNQFRSGDGLVTKGVENTICNIGKMASLGMDETDREILNIMCNREVK